MVERIEAEGIECEVFDRVVVEPTLDSFQEAGDAAVEGGYDGFVGVGGGSSLDTAKVAALVASHPAPVLDYVYPPIGGGKKPPGPLKPLVAIPTTAGTGSEATTVAVLDFPDLGTKGAISHRYLRPVLGVVDPLLAMSCPPQVTASCGLDVVTHAVESFTARPYTSRPAPETPTTARPTRAPTRSPTCGRPRRSSTAGEFLRRAVSDPDDVEARGTMMLGASIAGVGFGSAGTHIPHACAYPIASLKHEWSSEGYPDDHAFVPHGFAVVVTAPAAFRFTFEADPEKHRLAAELLSGEPLPEPDPEALPAALISLMRDVGAPSGLRELGYGEEDMEGLVQGALKQQRQLSISPREAGPAEIEQVFRESMENW